MAAATGCMTIAMFCEKQKAAGLPKIVLSALPDAKNAICNTPPVTLSFFK